MQVANMEPLPRVEDECALVGTTSAAVEEPSMADIGRNDPCPCGSGKKYKRCHLFVEEAAPAPVGRGTRLTSASSPRCCASAGGTSPTGTRWSSTKTSAATP